MIAGLASLGRELDAQLPGRRRVAARSAAAASPPAWGCGRRPRGRPRGRGRGAALAGVVDALAAGAITPIEVGDTLADGIAGNIERGSVTFELVRDHVEAVVGVSEPEIEEAMRFLARAHGIVAEGAGAAAVAAVLAGRVARGDEPPVVVVSGRNVALPRLAECSLGVGACFRIAPRGRTSVSALYSPDSRTFTRCGSTTSRRSGRSSPP